MSLPQFFAAIGSDRYLSAQEVAAAAGAHAELDTAWHLYTELFGGFCGSRLDPQFARHSNPVRQLGTLALPEDATVLVVGVGPSLEPQLSTLRQLRSQVLIVTSPEGAERLAVAGLIPDLVLVEPPTALDIHPVLPLSASARSALGRCPLVAVSPRTSADILYGVQSRRMFVPDQLSSWGFWQSTAVALAIEAGARRVGLLGVDLGGPQARGPRQVQLASVLSLLAWISDATCLDCGPEGARKSNWPLASLDELVTGRRASSPAVALRPWRTEDQRYDDDQRRVAAVESILERAEEMWDLALRTQSGSAGKGDARMVEDAAAEIMAWSQNATLRAVFQETLSLSVLPRLWRNGMGVEGSELWRPIVLAMHELVHQAEKLQSRLALRLVA